jgi:hypothetical protein
MDACMCKVLYVHTAPSCPRLHRSALTAAFTRSGLNAVQTYDGIYDGCLRCDSNAFVAVQNWNRAGIAMACHAQAGNQSKTNIRLKPDNGLGPASGPSSVHH